MADFKKTVATAKEKVAKAEAVALAARQEALDAILQDAPPHDVLTLCVRALAEIAPTCCEAHQDEFKAERPGAGSGRGRRGRRSSHVGALRMAP